MSQPTSEQVTATLQAAKELLAAEGWRKEAYCLDGKRCLDGALRKVITGVDNIALWDMHDTHYRLLMACFRRLDFCLPTELVWGYEGQTSRSPSSAVCHNWNDDPKRLEEQVYRRLNDAIEGKEIVA